jgi:uncharacterized radical SAM superfamily protein
MQTPTAQTIWNLNTAQLRTLLDSGNLKPQSSTIRFYAPSFTYYKTKHYHSTTTEFPTISITGNSCTLNCKHCGGKVLQTMHAALTPEQLWQVGVALKAKGAKGVLVSGGCLPDGSVPIDGFVDVLFRFKQELALTVFVHTAATSPQTASALKKAEVDAALIDVVGSDQTIKKILNLNLSTQTYAQSLRALADAHLNVVPHIIVGLNEGKLDGELAALQIIAQTVKPAAVVIIAFMPIHGTQMHKTQPPKPFDIAKVAAAARTLFPKTPLALGCMRPKGKLRDKIDVLSLKAGVDAVAFPSEAAIQYAQKRGFRTVFSSYCCAQMYLDFL